MPPYHAVAKLPPSPKLWVQYAVEPVVGQVEARQLRQEEEPAANSSSEVVGGGIHLCQVDQEADAVCDLALDAGQGCSTARRGECVMSRCKPQKDLTKPALASSSQISHRNLKGCHVAARTLSEHSVAMGCHNGGRGQPT